MAQVLEWMSALSDLTRVRLLHACEQHELSVAEICTVLRIPQSTASRHLKVLSDERWLSSRRDGTSRFYGVNDGSIPPAARKLWKLIRTECDPDANLREDDARLERVLAQRRTQSQAFFASSAGHWDRLRSELFGGRIDVSVFLGLLDGAAVVGDLGCGTGGTTDLLADFAARVVAIDASAAMLKAARERLRRRSNVEFHRAGLESLPLDDGELDVAFVSLVLHHTSDPQNVLKEVARVLKPHGKVIIADMQQHDREDYRQQMGHVWLGFSPDQLLGWLREAGLTVARYLPLSPDPSVQGPPLFVATGQRPSTKN